MKENVRPPFDPLIQDIANYVGNFNSPSDLAIETAFWVFLDSVACSLQALDFSACRRLLGPVVPGATLTPGARVIGTNWSLDPVQAAFNNGALIRWLDFNDTWLAAEWGHPSDNIGGILSVMDYLEQTKQKQFSLHDLLVAIIKAHEIQGVLALNNSFNQVGLDHVVLVKVATTAVVSELLELDLEQRCNAISQAFVDGQSLRTYRHAPNTGSRKSWAAGDATARGVRLSYITKTGEMGYPSALSADIWGFQDVSMRGNPLTLTRELADYVMENILFKISYPAEFHGQTAVEAALKLHNDCQNNLDKIERIEIETQASGDRIINKTGPLHNPADRDHSLQYMIAIGLLYGELTASHYENDFHSAHPEIDQLRDKMVVKENPIFSKEYLDPSKRAIGNAIKLIYQDGSCSERIHIDYPVGHRARREEGIPLLRNKFQQAASDFYGKQHGEQLAKQCFASLTELNSPLNALTSQIMRAKNPTQVI